MRDGHPQDKKHGVKTQYQEAYEIFGALSVTEMVIEKYIRI